MVRLKHTNDEKSTTGDREFHAFITLSAKKFLRAVFVVCGFYTACTHDPLFLRACQMRKISLTLTLTMPKTIFHLCH